MGDAHDINGRDSESGGAGRDRNGAPRLTGRIGAAVAAGAPGLARKLVMAAVQFALIVAILQGYSLFRKTYFQRPPDVAFDNARQVIDLQEALGIAVTRVELPLQQWTIEHGWLIDFFNAYYRQFKPALYFAVLLCVLRAPPQYLRIRRVFLIATVVGFPCYALYPLAPPRLMEPFGFPFVDTLAVYGGTQSSSAGLGGANQFAAMPSMHIAWTAIVALWLAAALPRWRIGAVVGSVHLALMCLTVVVTGNHYVLDIVAGFAVTGVAMALARLIPPDWSAFRWLRQRISGRSIPPRAGPNDPDAVHAQPPTLRT